MVVRRSQSVGDIHELSVFSWANDASSQESVRYDSQQCVFKTILSCSHHCFSHTTLLQPSLP